MYTENDCIVGIYPPPLPRRSPFTYSNRPRRETEKSVWRRKQQQPRIAEIASTTNSPNPNISNDFTLRRRRCRPSVFVVVVCGSSHTKANLFDKIVQTSNVVALTLSHNLPRRQQNEQSRLFLSTPNHTIRALFGLLVWQLTKEIELSLI